VAACNNANGFKHQTRQCCSFLLSCVVHLFMLQQQLPSSTGCSMQVCNAIGFVHCIAVAAPMPLKEFGVQLFYSSGVRAQDVACTTHGSIAGNSVRSALTRGASKGVRSSQYTHVAVQLYQITECCTGPLLEPNLYHVNSNPSYALQATGPELEQASFRPPFVSKFLRFMQRRESRLPACMQLKHS
jgi:hypothetical protein